MTKIIVMSDTHLERSLPEKVVELAKGADLILHAGDFVAMPKFAPHFPRYNSVT